MGLVGLVVAMLAGRPLACLTADLGGKRGLGFAPPLSPSSLALADKLGTLSLSRRSLGFTGKSLGLTGTSLGLTGKSVGLTGNTLGFSDRSGWSGLTAAANCGGGGGALPFLLDLLGDVPTSGDVTGDRTEWNDDVDDDPEVGVTSEARQTGTRLVLMSTADWRMGLEIWRLRRLAAAAAGRGESRLWMVDDEAVDVGDTLRSSTDGFLTNLDLSLDERPTFSSVSLASLSLFFLSLGSSSMWQIRASENRAFGCSTVDHLGVKVALVMGGGDTADGTVAAKK